ncbi:hypothetical protein MRQ36_14230 [Micromonospora sp. R77]|uniref:hypothetical protein n=1 Tax=Micromonospora sp. R77 TaxID=2925836 RepID=UPI001F6183A1|nr:hypothetical protein [Micromonospora sp. R77]MCI4063680.1 hypothetical protein [Micromonospora sp. R77]
MNRSTAPPRPAGVSGGAIATLGALAAALGAAFVLAPPALAADATSGDLADQRRLTDALRAAFVDYWRSGDREFSPALERVVDYWFRFHLVKAAIAAVLLIVLIAAGVRLWTAFVRAGGLGAARRATLASAGVVVALLVPFSLAMVMANIQGAVAPYASLLPMLTDGATESATVEALTQIRQQLADSGRNGGRTGAAVEVMISDFARYHAVMAVIAAVVAVALVVLAVGLWKRAGRTDSSDRRARRVLRSFGVLAALSSLPVILVLVANTLTAEDPAPALLAFFEGGW